MDRLPYGGIFFQASQSGAVPCLLIADALVGVSRVKKVHRDPKAWSGQRKCLEERIPVGRPSGLADRIKSGRKWVLT